MDNWSVVYRSITDTNFFKTYTFPPLLVRTHRRAESKSAISWPPNKRGFVHWQQRKIWANFFGVKSPKFANLCPIDQKLLKDLEG
jgi:hypothetical protein